MDGLTAGEALEAQQMGLSLVPTAELAQRRRRGVDRRHRQRASRRDGERGAAAGRLRPAATVLRNRSKAGWEDAATA